MSNDALVESSQGSPNRRARRRLLAPVVAAALALGACSADNVDPSYANSKAAIAALQATSDSHNFVATGAIDRETRNQLASDMKGALPVFKEDLFRRTNSLLPADQVHSGISGHASTGESFSVTRYMDEDGTTTTWVDVTEPDFAEDSGEIHHRITLFETPDGKKSVLYYSEETYPSSEVHRTTIGSGDDLTIRIMTDSVSSEGSTGSLNVTFDGNGFSGNDGSAFDRSVDALLKIDSVLGIAEMVTAQTT